VTFQTLRERLKAVGKSKPAETRSAP